MRYLKRNLQHIKELKAIYETNKINIPIKKRGAASVAITTLVYEQQSTMHQTKTNSIPDRIVSIHQRYVRPIVRGKEGKKVELGSKLQVPLHNGSAFLDKLSWNNFSEGTCLVASVEKYKGRFDIILPGYWHTKFIAQEKTGDD